MDPGAAPQVGSPEDHSIAKPRMQVSLHSDKFSTSLEILHFWLIISPHIMSLYPSQNLTFSGITFPLNITFIIRQQRFFCHWLVRGMNAAPQLELECYCKFISYSSFRPLWNNYIEPLTQYFKTFKYSLQPSSKSNSTKVIFINIIVNYMRDYSNYLLHAGMRNVLPSLFVSL